MTNCVKKAYLAMISLAYAPDAVLTLQVPPSGEFVGLPYVVVVMVEFDI